MKLAKFYNTVLTQKRRDKSYELFPVKTHYFLIWSFPQQVANKPGWQIEKFNEMTNLLLQSISFPNVTYDGPGGGDMSIDVGGYGGFGGSFQGIGEADTNTSSSGNDLKLTFLNTKYSICERFFWPWVQHCIDTDAPAKYGIYPFVRATLDVFIFNESAEEYDVPLLRYDLIPDSLKAKSEFFNMFNVTFKLGTKAPAGEILMHYKFEGVYPYEIDLNGIDCSTLKSEMTRSVSLTFNNFKLITKNSSGPIPACNPQIFTEYHTPDGGQDLSSMMNALKSKTAENSVDLKEAGEYILDGVMSAGEAILDGATYVGEQVYDGAKWVGSNVADGASYVAKSLGFGGEDEAATAKKSAEAVSNRTSTTDQAFQGAVKEAKAGATKVQDGKKSMNNIA